MMHAGGGLVEGRLRRLVGQEVDAVEARPATTVPLVLPAITQRTLHVVVVLRLLSLSHAQPHHTHPPTATSPAAASRRHNNVHQLMRNDSAASLPRDSVAEWLRRRRARVQIAIATLSGNSLRQTVHTHCASVHQAAKLIAALLRVAGVTAGLAESNGSLPSGL